MKSCETPNTLHSVFLSFLNWLIRSIIFILRVSLPLQIRLPAHQERKKVVEDVDKDRRYIIDASIVRIMKSRKILSHQQLNAQIVEQLRQLFKVWYIYIYIYTFQKLFTYFLIFQ